MAQTCPTLEVCEVALLVEAGLVEAESVDDVNLGLDVVIGTLLLLLLGSVGTGVYNRSVCRVTLFAPPVRTERLSTDCDLSAVGLVDYAVNLLEVVRVRDHLIVGDDILRRGQYCVSGR